MYIINSNFLGGIVNKGLRDKKPIKSRSKKTQIVIYGDRLTTIDPYLQSGSHLWITKILVKIIDEVVVN